MAVSSTRKPRRRVQAWLREPISAPVLTAAARANNGAQPDFPCCHDDQSRRTLRRVGPLLAHYRSLARGGVGTIVTEGMRADPGSVSRPSNIPAYDPKRIPGLARWADTVHAEGALIIGQIHHSGRQHTGTTVPGRLVAPSAIACPRSGGVPHALRDDEIMDYIGYMVASAHNMCEAGLDGIEVHGAQGHLVQQFLSPFSNKRTDRWGGSWDNRLRFVIEILSGIRKVAKRDFLVGLAARSRRVHRWRLDRRHEHPSGRPARARPPARLRFALAGQFQFDRYAPSGPAFSCVAVPRRPRAGEGGAAGCRDRGLDADRDAGAGGSHRGGRQGGCGGAGPRAHGRSGLAAQGRAGRPRGDPALHRLQPLLGWPPRGKRGTDLRAQSRRRS